MNTNPSLYKLSLIVLITLLFGSSGVEILLDQNVNLREGEVGSDIKVRFGGSNASDIISVIPQGEKVELTGNFDKNKNSGIGVEVVFKSNGESKIGWVYFHRNSTQRLIRLIEPHSDNIVNVSEGDSIHDFHQEFEDKFNELKKKNFRNIALEAIAKTPFFTGRQIPEWLIEKVITYLSTKYNDQLNGLLRNMNSDPDGLKSFIESTVSEQSNCKPQTITNWGNLIPAPMRRFASFNPKALDQDFIEGCEELAFMTDNNQAKLELCYKNIKKVIRSECSDNECDYTQEDREKAFHAMYEKLNPIEQRFFAYTLTAEGEAGGNWLTLADRVLVMQVMENRMQRLREYDPETNEMDTVLYSQCRGDDEYGEISMYNLSTHIDGKGEVKNDGNWHNYLNSSRVNSGAIEAYIQFQNCPKANEDLFYYHSSYVEKSQSRLFNNTTVYESSRSFTCNGVSSSPYNQCSYDGRRLNIRKQCHYFYTENGVQTKERGFPPWGSNHRSANKKCRP